MYNEQMDYDKNGNLQHLNRNGDFDDDDTQLPLQIDQLVYSYHSSKKNQLMRVKDISEETLGFKDDNPYGNDPDDDYTYDAFGNMKSDTNKAIDSISYNHLNLPTEIYFAGGNKIKYLYNALGQKVQKVVTDGSSDVVTDYQDGYQYSNGILSFFPHAEGYVRVTYCPECETQHQYRYNYVYNYLDHLGNIRLSYAEDPETEELKILEENHYYPFGLKHTNYNTNIKDFKKGEENPEVLKIKPVADGGIYNYKYNGHELQDELGLNVYAYGWRDYDPSIGRFNKMDRYSEKYMERSPYNYAANNPVYYIDVAGDSLFVSHGKMTLRYENGKFYNKDNSEHTGKLKGFFKKAAEALGQMSKSQEGAAMLTELESSNNNFTIEKSSKNEFVADDSKKAHANQFATDPAAASSFNMLTQSGFNFNGGSGGKIFWDPSGSPLQTTAGLTTNSMTDLAHEMFHGLDSNRGLLDSRLDNGVSRKEWQAVYRENILRAELTLPVRTYYQSTLDASGNKIPYGPRMLTPANQPIQPTGYKH